MFTDNLRERPVMNLQRFAEGEPPVVETTPTEPAGTVQPDPGTPAQGTPGEVTPEERGTLLEYLQRQMDGEPEGTPAVPEGAPAEPQPPAPAPPVQEELILGKFKTQKDLENAYLEEQRRLTQYGQQFSQLQGQWQQFLTQQQRQQQQPPQQPQLTPEQIQKQNEDWYYKFQDKPLEALAERERQAEERMQQKIQETIQQFVAPVAQKIQYRESYDAYNQQLREAREKYPDFDQLMPEMNKIVQTHGQYYANVPNSVEAIYGIAKARTGTAGQPQRPLEDLLQDPQVREKIMSDPAIKNAVLKNYAQEIRQGRPPNVIGSQPGETPASPAADYSQPGSAKKSALSYFRSIVGGGPK